MAQQHASGCWWLDDVKKLDLEWQSVCARAQQQLMKIADSIQKTTYVPLALHSLPIMLECLLRASNQRQHHSLSLTCSCFFAVC